MTQGAFLPGHIAQQHLEALVPLLTEIEMSPWILRFSVAVLPIQLPCKNPMQNDGR
jgi:hypothetical protein